MDRSTCHAYSNLASEPSNSDQRQLTVYSIYSMIVFMIYILYILYNVFVLQFVYYRPRDQRGSSHPLGTSGLPQWPHSTDVDPPHCGSRVKCAPGGHGRSLPSAIVVISGNFRPLSPRLCGLCVCVRVGEGVVIPACLMASTETYSVHHVCPKTNIGRKIER